MRYELGDTFFDKIENKTDDGTTETSWCVYEIVDFDDTCDCYVMKLIACNDEYKKYVYLFEREVDVLDIVHFEKDCPIEAQVCAHLL